MNQDLRKEMQNYPNERIINNITQQNFFSPESVTVAKEIAIQRNLLTQTQIDKLGYHSQLQRNTNRTERATLALNNAASNNDGPSAIGVIVGVLIVIKIIIKLAIISN